MRTPRTRFMEDEARAARVLQALNSRDMEAAFEAAWAQFCRDLGAHRSGPFDPDSMREGARLMLDCVYSIAKKPVERAGYKGGLAGEA